MTTIAASSVFHPSIPHQHDLDKKSGTQEEDGCFLIDFKRLLVKYRPSRRQFFTLFQILKMYFAQGHDAFWLACSEEIEDEIPCSQAEYFDYRFHYDRYRHPSRRMKEDFEVDNGGYTDADFSLVIKDHVHL